MTIINKKFSKVILIISFIIALLMNILGALFWLEIISSKGAMLFITTPFIYLPGFTAQVSLASKEELFSYSLFIIFIVLYRTKIKKSAKAQP